MGHNDISCTMDVIDNLSGHYRILVNMNGRDPTKTKKSRSALFTQPSPSDSACSIYKIRRILDEPWTLLLETDRDMLLQKATMRAKVNGEYSR